MKVNINRSCNVSLTPSGYDIYKTYTLQFYNKAPDVKSEYKFQLWEIMQIFGPHIYMGMKEPLFIQNSIEISDE